MSKKKLNQIKILATLGPSSMNKSIVQKMDSFGVDMFRINLSHTKPEDLPAIIENISQWTKKPICLDTEGAQIRTGRMKNDRAIIKQNSIITLTSAETLGHSLQIPLYPILPAEILQLGDILYIDFHLVIVQIIKIEKGRVLARVLFGGEVGSNKAVNIDRFIELPPFTQKDIKALKLAQQMGLTHFALSFATRAQDLKQLRSFFAYPVFLISKIESRRGLSNLKGICKASDAILIDRGDLSREISLPKIGLMQRHILGVAKKINTPVYVATNLLDSMMDNFRPTRSEINDITSTLLSGAEGLVLAAETAIGKHPVESVRMASGIIKEVENYRLKENNFLYDFNLIEPHGGTLVQSFISPEKIEGIENLPSIEVNDQVISEIVQIAEGTYSPLRGFMNSEELMSVLDHYKLPDGIVWTLPILLQFHKKHIRFNKGETITIRRYKDKKIYALMEVANIEKINLSEVALKWFGTEDRKHPGVANFFQQGEHIVSGRVYLLQKPFFQPQSYTLTPRQTRQIFRDYGWQEIVGFHTRNPIHLGHEFIQKKALELSGADGLFITPIIGLKKEGDFSAEAILRSYEIMLQQNFYSPYRALVGTFNTFSRYSGPREAVFTALCRKNFGCSHFIIGRDHTGVGNYYLPDASHRIFDKIGDIGVQPIMFDTVYFCRACKKITDSCHHNQEQALALSGTKVREYLLRGLDIPEYLMRKEISEEFQKMYKFSKTKVFEGIK